MPKPCTVCLEDILHKTSPTMGCFSSFLKILAAEVMWGAVEEGGWLEESCCRGDWRQSWAEAAAAEPFPSPAQGWSTEHAGHLMTVLWHWQWAGRWLVLARNRFLLKGNTYAYRLTAKLLLSPSYLSPRLTNLCVFPRAVTWIFWLCCEWLSSFYLPHTNFGKTLLCV